jgi:uncharacterized protein YqgC (DUF456 family)
MDSLLPYAQAIVTGLLGSLIPVPLVGSLSGMLVGSFVCVYAVERRRLPEGGAAGIAWGTVIARVAVLLLKVTVTLGMIAALIVRLARG